MQLIVEIYMRKTSSNAITFALENGENRVLCAHEFRMLQKTE